MEGRFKIKTASLHGHIEVRYQLGGGSKLFTAEHSIDGLNYAKPSFQMAMTTLDGSLTIRKN